MAFNFKHFGPKRALLVALTLTSCLSLTALTSAHFLTPTTSYEYLQDHLDKSQTLSNHTWLTATDDLQAELSARDMIDMSDILDAEALGKSELGQRTIILAQALQELPADCSDIASICNKSIRINRTLKPVSVHGDYRIVNVIEESQRIDISVGMSDLHLSINEQVREKRNLRFIKTRDGWMLKTIDLLEQEKLGERVFPDLKSSKLAGVNYYPASASWSSFWTEFPKHEIDADLATIADLGGNAVRIFLSYSVFSDAETHSEYLGRLTTFLDMCDDKGIKVLLTFFDLRSDYRIETWEADTIHIRSVLENIAGHPALFGVDLKNEPDLDAPVFGFPMIEAWIETMAGFIHSEFPGVPVTVGWSNSTDANRVANELDFISYHDFKSVSEFERRFKELKNKNSEKLIVVSEIGSTVWSPPFSEKQNEKRQARRLASQLEILDTADGFFVWTLNDFQEVKSNVAGARPWRKAQQAHFGLKRLDGSLRPAANVLREYNHNNQQNNAWQ